VCVCVFGGGGESVFVCMRVCVCVRVGSRCRGRMVRCSSDKLSLKG
jgi:hypothetical protein